MNSQYQQNFVERIAHYAKTRADHPACVFQPRDIDTAESLSYGELYQKVEQRARYLIAKGYQNQSLALLFPAGLDFVVNFIACMAAGAVAVPLNLSRNAQQLERTICVIDDADVKAILTVGETQQVLESQLLEIPALAERQFVWLNEQSVLDEHQAEQIELPQLDMQQLAFIQYTSGSTSAPKGVLVNHLNVVDNQEAIRVGCGHVLGSNVGGWLPQFHDMGLIGHLMQPLYMGGTYVFLPPMNFIQRPSRWLKLISHYKIETSASPNFGYEHCVKLISDREDLSMLDLSCWKAALNGSEPVSADTMRRFCEKFAQYGFDPKAFFPCYGMAETTLFVSGGPRNTGMQVMTVDKDMFEQGVIETDEKGLEIVNCGQLSGHFQAKIVNPVTCDECPPNGIGEIWLNGPSVAQGYFNNEEKTEQDFRAQLQTPDGKHYLRTGDLGFIAGGDLYVTGRIKELLIVKGRNIYPYDIERTCNNYQYAAGNSGAAVFTYQDKGETKLGAVVEIKRKFLRDLDEQELVGDLRALIVAQHEVNVDKLMVVLPGVIPKTTSGKLKRNACHTLLN